MAHLGVVNTRGRTKVRFIVFVALIIHFEARLRHFASCESTGHSLSRLDVEIFDNDNDGTNYFTPLRACARGNKHATIL